MLNLKGRVISIYENSIIFSFKREENNREDFDDLRAQLEEAEAGDIRVNGHYNAEYRALNIRFPKIRPLAGVDLDTLYVVNVYPELFENGSYKNVRFKYVKALT